ncbi:MAG: Tetratricopeptide 1 repeat-containing protein [Deltaproteobacteria bacterium]|nr:Tetratricopeptide 1 repeat-containing protein [Deltaproteobacteria bacterium]
MSIKGVLPGIAALTIFTMFLFSCAGVPISPEVRADFNAGLNLFNQGKFESALPLFQKAVTAEPDYYEAQLYLGRTYLNMKDYGRAVPPLRRAHRLSPDDFKSQVLDILLDALLGAAFAELGKGNFESTLMYVREIMSASPKGKKIKDDMSNVLVAVATGLARKGDVRDAVNLFREAIKENPDNIKAYLGLAKTLIKSGAISEAIENAQKAMALDPTSNEAMNVLKEMLR